ncbi:hypothetical protein BFX40_10130 [Mesorhizobium sp. SEMIA 3007]|uniref:hypothetical protein n=1 Tax=Mesorhizobium sp. SEMIA 3007 TaxID=1862350 RepID=UPI00083D0387|nr:hypothetical protein [Mesorhizobium sp. SEMIA 3007]ODA93211.1 hypothetical protein BFX40_10130 [Mesorhizobium sp. SEMIA 3007]
MARAAGSYTVETPFGHMKERGFSIQGGSERRPIDYSNPVFGRRNDAFLALIAASATGLGSEIVEGG